uniref:Putative urease accessory protein uref posttranslational modification n=2 Tax=Ixodes ricinus TaxID=34613 RepID=V5HAU6_IXORI
MDSTAATSLLLNLLQISDSGEFKFVWKKGEDVVRLFIFFVNIIWDLQSAFPTGSFAHSGGFEAAGQRGFIDRAGSFMTPFMREAHQQWTNPEAIRSLDCKLSASLTNHVASRASIQQGRSLIQTACATYAAPQLVSLQDQIYDEELNGHQAVMYGVLCGFLGIPETQAAISFLFGTLRTMVASAVRLGTTGTLEGQRIQYQLQARIPDIVERNRERTPCTACNTFPLVDLMQNSHDLLFSRMFYS